MAAPGHAHPPGGVWEEGLQDLSFLHHGAQADPASSLSHRHRSVLGISLGMHFINPPIFKQLFAPSYIQCILAFVQ